MPRFPGTQIAPGVFWPRLLPFVGPAGGPFIQSPAVLDSGADTTVVPLELVELLVTGMTWDNLEVAPDTKGVGGPQQMRKVQVIVAWPTPTDVICTEVLVTRPTIPILLGREDFFRRYSVRFHWQHMPPVYLPWFQVDPLHVQPMTGAGRTKARSDRKRQR